MAKFVNSFNLISETADQDLQELLNAVDERAEDLFLVAAKKKAKEAKKRAEEEEERKKVEEKNRLQLDIKEHLVGGQKNNAVFYRGRDQYSKRDFNSQRFPGGPRSADARSVSSTTSTRGSERSFGSFAKSENSLGSFGRVSNGGNGFDSKRTYRAKTNNGVANQNSNNGVGLEKEEEEKEIEVVVEKQQQEQSGVEQSSEEQGINTQIQSNGGVDGGSNKSSDGKKKPNINGSLRRKLKRNKKKNQGESNGADVTSTASVTVPAENKVVRSYTLKEYEEKKKMEKLKKEYEPYEEKKKMEKKKIEELKKEQNENAAVDQPQQHWHQPSHRQKSRQQPADRQKPRNQPADRQPYQQDRRWQRDGRNYQSHEKFQGDGRSQQPTVAKPGFKLSDSEFPALSSK